MSLTIDAPARATAAEAKLRIVDCDIHPAFSSPAELASFLPERWRAHVGQWGARVPQPFLGRSHIRG